MSGNASAADGMVRESAVQSNGGTSDNASGLANAVDRLISASGPRAPTSCLWIGRNDAFLDALSDQVARSGSTCAFYLGQSTSGERQQGIAGSYDVPGLPVETAAFPKLADILGFAQTQADPAAILTDLAQTKNNSRDGSTRSVIEAVREDFGIKSFDLVVIAGESLLADAIVAGTLGSKAVLIDGTRSTFGGAAAYARLFSDTEYLLAANNDHEQGGWALFVQRDQPNSNLPVHFFTIILNGEPFIRYHEQMLLDLECPWHWHVIEGVASLVKDTAWSVAAGGHIPDSLHDRGKSNDGTTQYLDELQARYPNRVTIYRKPDNVFWDGKLEMVSAPIPNIAEECLLWQIDGDELWTADQIHAVRRAFIEDPERTAAYFWCNYYVGPDRGISTRLNYAQNPNQEWLRVWRFQPGMIWDKHEPPVLAGFDESGNSYDVGRKNPFLHRETEAIGATFDHFAYVTADQARFKESYYGYANAVSQWQALQDHTGGSGHLREYFAWVSDDTMFDTVDRMGWSPIAHVDPLSGKWCFRTPAQQADYRSARRERRRPRIVVDGVFFQLGSSGIARLWIDLLNEWVRSGYAENVVVLDRGKTAPRIDGLIYRTIDRHDWSTIDGDARMLQQVCDMEEADLFVSTYYTTPVRTPSVFVGYDMIPERMGFDLDDPWWRQKRRAIQYAVGHTMISNSSANDMCEFHPDIDRNRVLTAYCSVSAIFRPTSPDEVEAFREKFQIDRPFVVTVGERVGWKGYKNGAVVFAALAQMPEDRRPLLICVGGQPELEDVGKALLSDSDYKMLQLGDEDLRACYGAAQAFICPSSLEGFGLPIAEAMTVGCPALVCRNSSIPEVAGDAGIYFDPNDPATLIAAIERASDPAHRDDIIARGILHVAKFDQVRTAREYSEYFEKIVNELRSGHLRVSAQALEDAFRDAEARRKAEVEASRLEAALLGLKHQAASKTRITPTSLAVAPIGTSADVATIVAAQDNGMMLALERRLAAAYARLRAQDNQAMASEKAIVAPPRPLFEAAPSVSAEPMLKPAIFDVLSPVETRGLNDVEGPYVEAGMPHRIRWQVASTCHFEFDAPEAGKAIFEFDFCNVEPDQHIRVIFGEDVIGSASPPEAGWDHTWHAAFPLNVKPGRVVISVEAERSAVFDDDGSERFLAYLGASLRPDRTESV